MAKKRNVDLYGKSWKPIDIPNLEKAVKLYERLNYLNNHFADSLQGANAIWGQINEKADIQTELEKLGIKATQEQCQEILKVFKARELNNNLIKKGNELVSASDMVNFANNQKSKPTGNYKTAGNIIQAAYSQQQANKQQSDANRIYTEVSKSVLKEVKEAGGDISSQKVTDTINSRAAQKISEAAGKYGKASNIIKVAAETLDSAIKTFWNLFTNGAKRQAEMYEKTFQNISVRTGMTRGGYQSNQFSSVNKLNDMGLYNNIAMSDVQDMMNNLANIGMSEQDMTANAIENVITRTIVPYLDTTSLSVNLLNQRLDGNFVKQIRGINAANLDIAGANYATEDLLNTMIDLVQPMSDKAVDDLAAASTEVTTMTNKLINQYGWDKDTATKYAKDSFKYKNYSAQTLSSASLADKMTYQQILAQGLNPSDLKDANDIIGVRGDVGALFTSMTPGYGSGMDTLLSNTIGETAGISQEEMFNIQKLLENGTTMSNLANETNITSDELMQYSNDALNNFAEDNNQTQKQLQEITAENTATHLAVLEEKLGNWFDVLTVAVKGITSLVMVYLGGKFLGGIGKLLGIGSASGAAAGSSLLGGIGSALGVAGPIALGVGAVAAGIYAGYKLWDKKQAENAEEGTTTAQNYSAQLQAQGVNEGLANLSSIYPALTGHDTSFNDSNGFMSSVTADALGIKRSIFKTKRRRVSRG